MKQHTLILCTLLLMFPLARAGAEEMLFSRPSGNGGLQSSRTYTMIQDRYGFLWFGTSTGLYRYDGNESLQLNYPDHNGFNSDISCLLADSCAIYAATNHGLYAIDIHTYRISEIPTAGNRIVRAIQKDVGGNLWVGTSTGLLKIRDDEVMEYNTYTSNISHNLIRSLYLDSGGILWVGTHDGLNRMNPDGSFEKFDLKGSYKPEMPNNLILDIVPYGPDDSILLVGTETGLVFFDRSDNSFRLVSQANSQLSNEVIKCIYVVGDKIWLGTNFGLNIIGANEEITSYFHESFVPHSPSNNVVWDIFPDNGGILWLLTDNGPNMLNENFNSINFRKISYPYKEHIIGKQIRRLHIADDGTLYAATDNGINAVVRGGIENFDTVNGRLLMPNTSDILEDSFGRLWIGTTGGLNIYDPRTDRMHNRTTASTPFSSNYIAAVRKFGPDDVYVSVWESGIYRIPETLDIKDNVEIHQLTASSTNRFFVSGNSMWFEKHNKLYQINIINGRETEAVTANRHLGNRRIESMLAHGGEVYIGTKNGVLVVPEEDGETRFITVNTAREESVVNLAVDLDGTVWGSTGSSIFRIGPDKLALTINFGSTFPMRNIHGNCMAVSQSNIIYCGGDDGYIFFRPGDIVFSEFDPPVYITTLSVNNKRVDADFGDGHILSADIAFTSTVRLNYSQRNIAMGFASLHYGTPHANRYRYRIEGVDKDWITTDWMQNSAVYSNLPAGNYRLVVQGTNNYGVWSTHEAVLDIFVKRPLLLHVPFILLYVAMLVAFVVWMTRLFTKRMRLLNELRLVRHEKEYSEKLAQTKIDFFTNISHEFRTPLSLITPPLKEALESDSIDGKSRRLIEIACNNSEKLLKLVNQLLDIRRIDDGGGTLFIFPTDIIPVIRKSFEMFQDTAVRANIRYVFVTEIDSLEINCDPEKIETIVYNLLSNAFKFTSAEGLIFSQVRLRTADGGHDGGSPASWLDIIVSDTGTGIEEREQERIFDDFYRGRQTPGDIPGSGIGLSIVRKYAEMHSGRVSVRSLPGKGSEFTVSLPVVVRDAIVADIATDGEQTAGTSVNGYAESGEPIILYVEDSENMVEFVKLSLRHKYNIVSAPNGREGYEKCVALNPKLVITDIMMPGVDGLQMSRMIKEDPRTRHIPIIMLTAKSLARDQVEGLSVGIDMYIVKPVYPEVLDANIEQILMRRRQMEEYFENEIIIRNTDNSGRHDLDKKFISDVIDLIESRLSDPGLGVEAISETIGISPAHLYRRIKKLTGISTNELIRKYRLKKASLLINGNKGSISEIMYYTGFSSSSYFSKCFRAEFGMSPTEYKEKAQAENNT